MPRRGYKKITTHKDPIYSSYEVAKLINYVMRDGKKTVAQRGVYSALKKIKSKKLDPINVLSNAIINVSPIKEVKSKRVGGASYLVPMDTRPSRRIFLALNWIVDAANKRPNKEYKSFDEKLAAELIDAYSDQGQAVEKKRQVEKLAEANKAFAHFRW
ncbi:MAG: 30S ribosomal protein S7 [Candidatus Paceibacterota bacterium]